MHYLGIDGHDFIYDKESAWDQNAPSAGFLSHFDWILSNNTITRREKRDQSRPLTIVTKTDFISKYATLLCEVSEPFILISCASQYSPMYHFYEESTLILENPNLLAWYSENNTFAAADGVFYQHPKMRGLPFGLNFHNTEQQRKADDWLRETSIKECCPRKKEQNLLYAWTGYPLPDEYTHTFAGIKRNLLRDFHSWIENKVKPFSGPPPKDIKIHYLLDNSIIDYYNTLKTYKFLLCPCEGTITPGSPRVWEALALDVIPVLLYNSYAKSLYNEFPIWFVSSWEDVIGVDYELKYKTLWFDAKEKLSAKWWAQRIITREGEFIEKRTSPVTKYKSIVGTEELKTVFTAPNNAILAFSFCIYGCNPKYYAGLWENIHIIRDVFPKARIFIIAGKPVDPVLFQPILDYVDKTKRIKVIYTNHSGVINMIFRYIPILHCDPAAQPPEFDYLFVRDTDSIINKRDIWCITDFIARCKTSAYSAHVIRDHFYHRSRLTGGLTGFTVRGMKAVYQVLDEKIANISEADFSEYGKDEAFLNENLYSQLMLEGAGVFVHSNMCVFTGECNAPILCRNTLTNFCGNVLEQAPVPYWGFRYNDFNIDSYWSLVKPGAPIENTFIRMLISMATKPRDFQPEQFTTEYYTLKNSRHAFELLSSGFMQFPYDVRPRIIEYLIESFLDEKSVEGCMLAYSLFTYCEITPRARGELMHRFMETAVGCGRKIKCMTSGAEIAVAADEIQIIYGNFPDDYLALPSHRSIYRNIMCYETDLWKTAVEWVEPAAWQNIKRVYLMGLESAPDRIYETKQELARMGVALPKIRTYLAQKDESREAAYLGATKNHLDCIADAFADFSSGGGGAETDAEATPPAILFLEDDFVFVRDAGHVNRALNKFFGKKYDYDVCFLAASKLHERIPLDDVVAISRQLCTTSSGYMIPCGALERILGIVREGYLRLKETGDSGAFCIDRFWTKIQPTGKMIMFKDKLGFQRPSISKITGRLNDMLD